MAAVRDQCAAEQVNCRTADGVRVGCVETECWAAAAWDLVIGSCSVCSEWWSCRTLSSSLSFSLMTCVKVFFIHLFILCYNFTAFVVSDDFTASFMFLRSGARAIDDIAKRIIIEAVAVKWKGMIVLLVVDLFFLCNHLLLFKSSSESVVVVRYSSMLSIPFCFTYRGTLRYKQSQSSLPNTCIYVCMCVCVDVDQDVWDWQS